MRPSLGAAFRRGGPGRPRGSFEPSASLTSGHLCPTSGQDPVGPARSALRTGPAVRAVRCVRAHGVSDPAPLGGAPAKRVRSDDREVIRASRSTALRYARARSGELVHVDVKKLGRIPPGGGWRMLGRNAQAHRYKDSHTGVGYDYVHSMVDDHSRFAYSEILADETGASCAGFLARAAAAFRAAGISCIDEVMTDNAMNYARSQDFQRALGELEAVHLFIRPHCPWLNGKVERLNRTLSIEWAYRRPYTSNAQRTRALATWLRRYNTERPHSDLGGRPPISRLSPS